MSNASAGRARELEDGELLAHISNEVVRAQKEYFGKGPEQAKSYMLDDLLIVVLRGGMTPAEETMLEFGEQDMVRQFRQLFQNRTAERFKEMIGAATGRNVVNYQSQVLFAPDLVVEIFVFDSPGHEQTLAAKAERQLRHDDTGAATDVEALEEHSENGQ